MRPILDEERKLTKRYIYVHTFLWCPKRSYEGLKLIFILTEPSEMHMTGRIKYFLSLSIDNRFNPSSANPLSVFDHFVILALKGLKSEKSHKTLSLDLDCQEAAVRRCSYKKMF